MVSRNESYPDLEHNEKETIFSTIIYKKDVDGDLSGVYYIAIKGITESLYSI
jgi:hypothetical protein